MSTSDVPEKNLEAEARKVAFGAFVGTALEWYDYFLYGTAASLVFNQLYFVTDNPLLSTLAAFASFAVGFIARPVGAVIFGHLGDRIGRKKCLIITVTMIGVVTGVIGLLPTYFSIGLAAPILLTLLRIVQGVAVGGEWGGAVTLAVEHAPEGKRGRYAAMPQLGSPVGTLLSSGAFLLVGLLPSDSFETWGWRLPFLAAFPLLGIAIWLRRRIEESPLFTKMMEEHDLAAAPVKQVMTGAWRQLLIGAGSTLLGVGGFYLVTTFMIAYGVGTLGIPRSVMLIATLLAAAIEILVLLAGGRMVERYGAGPVTVFGSVLTAVVAFPVFWMVDTKNPGLVIVGVVLGIACLAIPYAASGTLLTELFQVRLRYSGVAISANVASVVSGFVPLIATGLLVASGEKSWAPALLLIVIALLTAGSGYLAPRYSAEPERDERK